MNDIREKTALAKKEQLLRKIIEDDSDGGKVMVAFSGGVDSGLLLWECIQALGAKRVIAVTVASPISVPGELECAKEYANRLGVDHVRACLRELDFPCLPTYIHMSSRETSYWKMSCENVIYKVANLTY